MTASLDDRLVRQKSALLVVDMQNDFCHEDGFLARRGIDLRPTQAMAPTLAGLIGAAREAGTPVIYTVNAHDEWTDSQAWKMRHQSAGAALCRPGTWGAEFYGVSPRSDERIVAKHRYDAFLGTELDLVLRAGGIRTLILTGVATNICIETTAREAYCRDYQLAMIEDCLAGSSLAEHRSALATLQRYFDAVVARAAELTALWRQTRQPDSPTLQSA